MILISSSNGLIFFVQAFALKETEKEKYKEMKPFIVYDIELMLILCKLCECECVQ